MAGEAAGTKAQRDQLRATLRDQGCTPEQIAAEMGRQFHFRPRQAWRHAHGWTQGEVAAACNRELRDDDDQAPMIGKRISDFEAWPHGGKKPSINTLAMLATVYSTAVPNLVDLDDRQRMSTKELLTLDTYNTPQTASRQSPDTPSENSTYNPGTLGERAVGPESNISITVHQTNRASEAATRSQRHRWHFVLAWFLAIVTAIGGGITAQRIGSQTTMPARIFTPSSPIAPGPLSTALLSPSLPSQIAPPQQPLIPLSPLTLSAPAPRQPSIRTTATPRRPDPLSPPPSESPTAKTASVSAATITWKNMYSRLCLGEHEGDGAHEAGTLRLWHCNGSSDQMWTENIIPNHPASLAKNLVNSKSGKCITYQPESDDQISVSLARCGQDGQEWVRHWNGKAYIFQAADIPGICMSAPNSPTAEGIINVQLRECGPSPLTDWLPYQ